MINQRLPLRLEFRRHFGNQNRGGGGVFIAHERTAQIAEALFRAEHELVIRRQIADHFGDIFKADEQMINRQHAETLGNAAD